MIAKDESEGPEKGKSEKERTDASQQEKPSGSIQRKKGNEAGSEKAQQKPTTESAVASKHERRQRQDGAATTRHKGRHQDKTAAKSAAESDLADIQEEKPKYVIKDIPKDKVFYATGRRKSSSARVFMKKGNGKIVVNKRSLDDYFQRKTTRTLLLQPLAYIDAQDKFDFNITVRGGGNTGQAGAIRHGISRALLSYDEEVRRVLRTGDFLTRDPRTVERKKIGLHKARKKPQYSKR